MSYGDELSELRKDKGLHQTELAKILDVTSGAISNYESGINYPSVKNLIKLSDFYNVNCDFLLSRTRIRTSWMDMTSKIKLSKHSIAIDDLLNMFQSLNIENRDSIVNIMNSMMIAQSATNRYKK